MCLLLPPESRAKSPNVVISEFRTFGPRGSSDEFIELYNLSQFSVDISGWEIWSSNPSGGSNRMFFINSGTIIGPGCYFLLTNSNSTPVAGPYSGPVPGDQTYTSRLLGAGGGVALIMRQGTQGIIIDQAGTSPTTTFLEGTALPTQTSANWTYERKPGGSEGSYQDTDDNANDFIVTQALDGAGNPQNSQSGCLPNTNPDGIATAFPSPANPGGNVLLTVNVMPGARPQSTGLRVTANLSSIEGASDQPFFDDATHGDVAANDNTFSFLAAIPREATIGVKHLRIIISDAEGRAALTAINLPMETAEMPPRCGNERWAIKTGTDSEAGLVDLNLIIPTTIARMRAWPAPEMIPIDKRFAPHERTVYAIFGSLSQYRSKDDSNYELIIRDREGNAIVCEIPCPCCVAEASPFLSRITKARKDFDDRFDVTDEFQSADIPVVIIGTGFFDSRRDTAPNGIELHPVLGIGFPAGVNVPVIIGASISGKKLLLSGLNLGQGATIYVNGSKQKSANDANDPTNLLIGKKAGKKIKPGESVTLKVINPDGTPSEEISFTRPN